MTVTYLAAERDSPKPRMSVSVFVEYTIDPLGKATVKDIKTLKNDGTAAAHLKGEFKQAINHNVSQVRITDSRSPGKRFPFQILRRDDHHQVAVKVETPDGNPFTVEPGSERSLIFDYEMSDSTTVLVGGPDSVFLINSRHGPVVYDYEFALIEYHIKYHISKASARWWQRPFVKPTLLRHPADMLVVEDSKSFHLEYRFSCDAKAMKYVHVAVILTPRSVVQWLAAFLAGVASSIAASWLWSMFT